MKPPDPPSEKYYLDRQNCQAAIAQLLKSGQRQPVLGDMPAIYGSGKTTLFAKFYYELKNGSDWSPIWIPLREFSISHSNTKIEDPTCFEAVIQNFYDFERLLVSLGWEIDPEVFADFSSLVNATNETTSQRLVALKSRPVTLNVQSGDIDIGALAKLSGPNVDIKTGDIHATFDDSVQEFLLFDLEREREQLSQEFVKRFNKISDKKKFVLFADDFSWVIDQKIGDWFQQVVHDMENIVLLVARTITEKELAWDIERLVRVNLEPFSFAEVQQYLNYRTHPMTLSKNMQQLVCEFSQGHPMILSLVGDLLATANPESTQSLALMLAALIGKQFTNAPGDGPGHPLPVGPIPSKEMRERLDKLVGEIRNDVSQKDARLLAVLNIGAVARRINLPLLAFVLEPLLPVGAGGAADGPVDLPGAQQRAAQMLQRLPRYSFVKTFHDRAGEPYYSFHTLIRERMEAHLRQMDPEYVERLHGLLAEYYHQGINADLQESTRAESSRVYRLEDPDWQGVMIEWLYHMCKLKDRSKARLYFARLFLEAFDWWGWYQPFKYCDDLISVWEQTQPAEDRGFLQLFQEFQAAYPPGYEKHGKGDWKKVYLVSGNIGVQLNLYQAIEKLDADQRTVRGHIERFQGDAFRFINQTELLEEAENHYQQALEYFAADWNKLRTLSYLADLDLELGWFPRAIERVSQSIKKAVERTEYLDYDHELLSRNYRILGDALFHQDDLNGAFQNFGRCLIHAYIFHFTDAPDAYSYSWYQDMGRHVIQVVSGLWRGGRQAEAQRACQYLRGLWWENVRLFREDIFARAESGLEDLLLGERLEDLQRFILPTVPGEGAFGVEDKIGNAVSVYMFQILSEEGKLPAAAIVND
jgi:hypothetical protein